MTLTDNILMCSTSGWQRSEESPEQRGLQIEVSLKHRDDGTPNLLSGIIDYDEDYDPFVLRVCRNDLDLDDYSCRDLLLAGCADLWNSLLCEQAVAAHTRWCAMIPWLDTYFAPATSNRLYRTVALSFGSNKVIHK